MDTTHGHIRLNSEIMSEGETNMENDDLWYNLEHFNSQTFTHDDYMWIIYAVKRGLYKRHGDINPEYAFLRNEEILHSRKNLIVDKTVFIPRMTVCYLRPNDPSPASGSTAVGFAFCSNGDNPNKWYGRALAFKRAVMALVARHLTYENLIREETEFATFLSKHNCSKIIKSFLAPSSDFLLFSTMANQE